MYALRMSDVNKEATYFKKLQKVRTPTAEYSYKADVHRFLLHRLFYYGGVWLPVKRKPTVCAESLVTGPKRCSGAAVPVVLASNMSTSAGVQDFMSCLSSKHCPALSATEVCYIRCTSDAFALRAQDIRRAW